MPWPAWVGIGLVLAAAAITALVLRVGRHSAAPAASDPTPVVPVSEQAVPTVAPAPGTPVVLGRRTGATAD